MESDFFEFFKTCSAHIRRLCLDIGYSSVTDFCISVYNSSGKEWGDWGEPIIMVQSCDPKAAFAEAYFKLCEYMNDKNGGY